MVGRVARVRWAAHGKEISSHLFSIFKNTDAESDCLLSCAGGRLFPAHRMVLAMASPFFSAIFESVPTANVSPLVILDGVEADQVEALMQYMYSGYSIVKCEKLPALCRTAKALGIKEFPSLEITPPVKRHFSHKDEVGVANKKAYLQNNADKIELKGHRQRTVHTYLNNDRSELGALTQSRNDRQKLDLGLPTVIKTFEQNNQILQRPIQSFNHHQHCIRTRDMEAYADSRDRLWQASENSSFVRGRFVIPRSPGWKPSSEQSTTSKHITSSGSSRLREALFNSATTHYSRPQWSSQVEPRRVKHEESTELVDVCSVSDDESSREALVHGTSVASSTAALPPSEKLQKVNEGVTHRGSSGPPIQDPSGLCTSTRSSSESAMWTISPEPAVSLPDGDKHRPSSLPPMAARTSLAAGTVNKQEIVQFSSPPYYIKRSDSGSVISRHDHGVDRRHSASVSGNRVIYVPELVYTDASLAKRSARRVSAPHATSTREAGFGRVGSGNTLKEESMGLKHDLRNSRTFIDVRTREIHEKSEQKMNNCSLEHDAKMNKCYQNSPPARHHSGDEEVSSSNAPQWRRSGISLELPRETCGADARSSTEQREAAPSYSAVPSPGYASTFGTASGSHSFLSKNTIVTHASKEPCVDIIQLDGKSDIVLSKSDTERNSNLPPPFDSTSDCSTFNPRAPANVSHAPSSSSSTHPQAANHCAGGPWSAPEQGSGLCDTDVSDNSPEHGANDPLLTKISTTKRRRVRGPKSWEFLLRLLRDPTTNPSLIRWENESEGVFRLVKPDAIALRWGKRTGKHFSEMLSYENFARGLRYHYVTGALSAVSERCFVYKFGPKAQFALKSPEKLNDSPLRAKSLE